MKKDGTVEEGLKDETPTLPHRPPCIDAFELWYWRRLESPLDCKEMQPVHSNGDQS